MKRELRCHACDALTEIWIKPDSKIYLERLSLNPDRDSPETEYFFFCPVCGTMQERSKLVEPKQNHTD